MKANFSFHVTRCLFFWQSLLRCICGLSHYVMKMYGGVKVEIHVLQTFVLDVGE